MKNTLKSMGINVNGVRNPQNFPPAADCRLKLQFLTLRYAKNRREAAKIFLGVFFACIGYFEIFGEKLPVNPPLVCAKSKTRGEFLSGIPLIIAL